MRSMKQTKHKRTALFWASVPISAVLLIVAGTNRPPTSVIASARPQEPTTQQTAVNTSGAALTPEKVEIAAGPLTFHTVKITNNQTLSSLKTTLGEQGIELVLKLNRLDPKHVQKGTTLVVPDAPAALITLSPFPQELEMGLSLPKLILVSREAQAFGAYESGKLVYWGPTSTGKKATQTPAGLYYTNWKKKETRSSVNPAWILPWAFNLDNLGGIAFHQYDLPGFPASHGCVRLLNQDAQWIYGWADTWILSKKDNSVVAYGTPVIIFGDYSYGKEAPWKRLPSDAGAASVSKAIAEQVLSKHLPIVEARAQARESLLLVASVK
jgi:lipoprotein-anchoring transpeptidase ErfK/SrfK